ncbi:D-alanyl-D-alanine carboxypeptidase/D-alanyl-D-alanine-endopeptidase (penicillin-binding protein 4) [Arcicella aurantiaca]|uniref:D-alanyl-D-alanine carboxypeptidase/D-alanyl-D-alanine-endopeptidase (Penicillin-binding protein 4) n=2 Tax=Arcicella aurantiaca TaxID=591202 RepID=A0A316EJJ1_9BACT|nr:D-alanyl-D-alanine carboxypeptidase/D-alanyl-D-alanine-endopeptidase (penicillin-binding protein 4) [Arcicella aurantiaca]
MLLLACDATKISMKSVSRKLKESPTFSQNFTGFALYDISEKKMLLEHNAERYFTPASNTKLFTFYASLKTLGDSIPALHYQIASDSLIIWGTGDPSFLNPDLPKSKVYDFLKNRPEKIYFSNDNFTGSFYGKGWAWDDYNDDYAAEVSSFPIHGNVVRFTGNKENGIEIQPKFFAEKTYNWSKSESFSVQRDLGTNLFSYPAGKEIKANYKQDVPFKTGVEVTTVLLADTLKKEVTLINKPLERSTKTIFSLPADSLYKRMLHVSDNMIAEHLMLLNADALGNELNVNVGIEKVKEKFLADLPDVPRWIDGSGLSRYNLFTPRSIVALLGKIHDIVPEERLFRLLPAAGKSGTLRNMMKIDEPFIFAKSGSLSNIYCLSGYLLTKKGKVFIFSVMNNNFTKSTAEIRKEMVNILTEIHQNN